MNYYKKQQSPSFIAFLEWGEKMNKTLDMIPERFKDARREKRMQRHQGSDLIKTEIGNYFWSIFGKRKWSGISFIR